MYTLNTIIKIQEDFAQAHQQINDFVFDQAYSYETKPELKYPLLWIDLEGSDLSETKDSAVWSDSYVFNVSVIDKVRENKEDEQEALNDCKLILNDYLIYLRQAEFPERLSIETTVSMKPLRMQGTDFVSGWQCQVKIQFVTDPDFCGIPLDSSSSSSPVVYTPYNYRVYFEDILGDALDNSNLAAYLNSPNIGAATGTSLAATGTITSSGTAGVGYATGAGGTVTQITSRTTGVTLNKITGAITLVSAAGSASYQSFTVTNSTVVATDTIVLCQKQGADKHILMVTSVAAGSFQITFATTGGTTVEQPIIKFTVLKSPEA